MDPLTDIISLLKPKAVLSKLVSGAGNWSVRYEKFGHPSFALVLAGTCWLAIDGHDPARLNPGDFVFLPATPGFVLASDLATKPVPVSTASAPEQIRERRHGDQAGEPSLLMQSGYFVFDPLNAPLLLERLPALIHIRSSDAGIDSVSQVVSLIEKEARAERLGRDLVLERLVEILLLESLRSTQPAAGLHKRGLLAGLRDSQLAATLQIIHRDLANRWTVGRLARAAGMSRSSFADRFAKTVGMTPIEYVLQLRMARARDLLRREKLPLSEIACAVGYESASAFSTAFRRSNGISPGAFARNLDSESKR